MLEMTKQNLRKVISNVLENMFFTFIEPVSISECAEGLKRAYFNRVGISLTGLGQRLDYDFYFDTSLAGQMTANFLGMEHGDLDKNQVMDVLKEMVNMVAGGLVNICDPEGRIVLGIPVCAEKTVSGQSLPCDNGDLNCYDSDDGFLVVCCQKKECFS
jgi:CheY-specific phosphatase CheX